MPFRSLSTRLAALVLGIMVVTVWATVSAMNFSVREEFTDVTEETLLEQRRLDDGLSELARTLAETEHGFEAAARRFHEDRPDSVGFLLFDGDLDPIYSTDPMLADSRMRIDNTGRASITAGAEVNSPTRIEIVTNAIQPVLAADGAVLAYLIAVPHTPDQLDGAAFARRAWTGIAIWLVLIVVAGMGLSLLVLRWAVRPIDRLTEAALVLDDGRTPDVLPTPNVRELEGLFRAFNSATATIARTAELRKQMIADVAHELRTPITNLRSQVEAFQAGLLTDHRALCQTLAWEVALLERLIGDFQQLALSESGQLDIRMLDIDLAELASAIVTPSEDRPDLEVVNNLTDPILIKGDPDRIQQVLLNLMENASRHRQHGLEITLNPIQDQSYSGISFTDNGPGIAEGAYNRIFERFYRGDISRQQDAAGAGLGLTIARSLMGAMGGSITASPRRSSEHTGAEFRLLFAPSDQCN